MLNYIKGVQFVEFDIFLCDFMVKYNEKKIMLVEICQKVVVLGYDVDDVKVDFEVYKVLLFCCKVNGYWE